MAEPAPPDRTSLRTRLAVVVSVFLALVIVASGLSALMVRSWDRSLRDRSELRSAAQEVSDLRLAYTEQESGVRGYTLTRDAEHLEPYRRGRALADAMEIRLRDHPTLSRIGLEAQLDVVERAAARWQVDVAEVGLDADAAPPDDALSQARFGELRTELDRLERIVRAELDGVVQRADDLKRNTFGVLIASAVAALLATALVTVLFRMWITRPLALIGRAARELSADEAAELPDFHSVELQDVVDAIRALQGSLARARDEAVTAYRGLEQSALLALHVRSELADELGDPPPGWAVGSALVPAEGVVAGDCYDLGLLDQHHLYVVMVDVTGHGATAALDALKSKSQLRAAVRSRLSPGAALDWLSRENRTDDRANLLTAVVAIVDVDSGECQYANAGHPAPLLTSGAEHVPLTQTGPLLGAFASSWSTETVTIPPGWTMLLYTDGITEALGPERERFGDDRLVASLADVGSADPGTLVTGVLTAVDGFRSGARNDDLTLVALQRVGRQSKLEAADDGTAAEPDRAAGVDPDGDPFDTVRG